MLYAALKAKKDVYLEKPLSKSLQQSLDMVKAVRQTDRIVQIGMQRRSIDKIQNAKKMVDDGVLGPDHAREGAVALECRRSRSITHRCPARSTGTASRAMRRSMRLSRCVSATGGISTPTPAAT